MIEDDLPAPHGFSKCCCINGEAYSWEGKSLKCEDCDGSGLIPWARPKRPLVQVRTMKVYTITYWDRYGNKHRRNKLTKWSAAQLFFKKLFQTKYYLVSDLFDTGVRYHGPGYDGNGYEERYAIYQSRTGTQLPYRAVQRRYCKLWSKYLLHEETTQEGEE